MRLPGGPPGRAVGHPEHELSPALAEKIPESCVRRVHCVRIQPFLDAMDAMDADLSSFHKVVAPKISVILHWEPLYGSPRSSDILLMLSLTI